MRRMVGTRILVQKPLKVVKTLGGYFPRILMALLTQQPQGLLRRTDRPLTRPSHDIHLGYRMLA